MFQFLSIIFFLGFLQFLLGFSKVPIFFCVILYFVFLLCSIVCLQFALWKLCDTELYNPWFAICTVQIILFGIAVTGVFIFALSKLCYRSLQCSTKNLQLALYTLCYALVHWNNEDLQFALYTLQYSLLHYRTADFQFLLRTLYYTLWPCSSVHWQFEL